ncbi:Beta-lactamase-like protein 2 [Physocladia obscura]|uniref:Beta-lactamase-like protein 2 n=1 Tax=Physocladia obscura TaxID=109957 RepID=A0AAD5SWC4_9FUNG|nr:Beta-lactamase-like protein 2 [Physocladia obscura]
MEQQLVKLADVAVLSPLVAVVRGLNPGKFTLQGTNTYLVGSGPHRLLVDTGAGVPNYIPLLLNTLRDLNASISDILITHRHYDHVGGILQILETLQSRNSSAITVWKRLTARDNDTVTDIKYSHIAENQVFTTTGATLRAICTPGHLDDHCCFFLEQEKALFSGDSVLGHGTTVFENLKEYVDSLQKTLVACGDSAIDRIYPGHGPDILDGTLKIQQYISHRVDRENEILKVMAAIASTAPACSSMQLVEIIYKSYDQTIWPAAERSVLLHLDKLVAENRVIQNQNNTFTLLKPSNL